MAIRKDLAMTDMNIFQQVGASMTMPSDRKVKKFLAEVKRAARKLDPATAEVRRFSANAFDPYEFYPLCDMDGEDVAESGEIVNYQIMYDHTTYYFARTPGSDMWVCEEDWPKRTYKALEKRGALKEARRRQMINFVKFKLADAERDIAKDLERGGWSAEEAAAIIKEALEEYVKYEAAWAKLLIGATRVR
jgi:hypothetical protein